MFSPLFVMSSSSDFTSSTLAANKIQMFFDIVLGSNQIDVEIVEQIEPLICSHINAQALFVSTV